MPIVHIVLKVHQSLRLVLLDSIVPPLQQLLFVPQRHTALKIQQIHCRVLFDHIALNNPQTHYHVLQDHIVRQTHQSTYLVQRVHTVLKIHLTHYLVLLDRIALLLQPSLFVLLDHIVLKTQRLL